MRNEGRLITACQGWLAAITKTPPDCMVFAVEVPVGSGNERRTNVENVPYSTACQRLTQAKSGVLVSTEDKKNILALSRVDEVGENVLLAAHIDGQHVGELVITSLSHKPVQWRRAFRGAFGKAKP